MCALVGGHVILRAPWGDYHEHLPCAARDWDEQGGAATLAREYRLREAIPTNRGVSGWYERITSP